MNRDEYIKLRQSKSDLLYYKYYLSKSKIKLDKQTFFNLFNQYIFISNINLNDFIDRLDKEFKVMIIYDVKGNLLKIL